MKIVLNDLSFPIRRKAWNVGKTLDAFLELVDELRKIGAEKVKIPSNFYSETFYGFPISNIFIPSPGFKERRTIILGLLDMVDAIDNDFNDEFSLKNTFSEQSIALAYSSINSLPSLSFPFEERFRVDSLKGFIGDKESHNEAKIELNIYDDREDNYRNLSPYLIPEDANPLVSPLWNKDAATTYMEKVDYAAIIKGVSHEEQRYFMMKCGKAIAEMNGWSYSSSLSSRNSDSNKKRIVFKSTDFKNQYAYLCIDLRHPDLHFELCGRRGEHLGEYSWNGDKLHDSQSGHSIDV